MPRPQRGREDEDEQHLEPAHNLVDPEIEEPTIIKHPEEGIWNVERQRVQRAVIIGAPDGGKSFLTALNLAYG